MTQRRRNVRKKKPQAGFLRRHHVHKHVAAHLAMLALFAVITVVASLTAERKESQAISGSPPMTCVSNTICSAKFYYNRTNLSEVATLNQHDMVILNHPTQFVGPNAVLPNIDSDTIALFYHLFTLGVKDGVPYDWPTMDANEDWFLHVTNDPTSTGRIQAPESQEPYTIWYMDVSNPEYRAFAIDRFQDVLQAYPGLDGFYLDFPSFYGVPPGPGCTGFACYSLPDLPCYAAGTCPSVFQSESNWNNFYVPALTELNTALGDNYIVHNDYLVPPFTTSQDGSFGEHFFHAGFSNENTWYSESSWKAQVDAMLQPELANQFTLVLSGQNTNTATTQILRFSLASFLLGRQNSAPNFFTFSDRTTDVPSYYSLYATDIGQPIAGYQQQCVSGTCIYSRAYTKGMAVVNPTTVQKSKILTGQYRDLDDVVAASVTLEAHTAQILFDVSAPAIPKQLRTTSVTPSAVALTWEEATENHYLASYRLYRDGVLLGSTSGLTLTDSTVTPGAAYTYSIDAIDGAGNASSQSSPISVTIPTGAPAADLTPPATINDLTAD